MRTLGEPLDPSIVNSHRRVIDHKDEQLLCELLVPVRVDRDSVRKSLCHAPHVHRPERVGKVPNGQYTRTRSATLLVPVTKQAVESGIWKYR